MAAPAVRENDGEVTRPYSQKIDWGRRTNQRSRPFGIVRLPPQVCEDRFPTGNQLGCMDERLEPNAKIRPDSRKSPALHSEEDVAIPTLVQAPERRGDQRGAKPSLPVLRRNRQVAQLSTAGKVEAGCRRIMDGANGTDPCG